jgi:hypothetical protein
MFGRDHLAGGHPDEVRSFPVTLRPHEAITLWVSVPKPKCHRGEGITIEAIPLRWSALGTHHVYWFPLSVATPSQLPISTCYPADALNHANDA